MAHRQPHTLSHIGDFDPAKFTIYASCATCGHSAPLDGDRVGQEVEVWTLPSRLRCAECGSRECSIRIVFTAAGEFAYGER
ncbi:MAG: hypothetical protein QNJ82_14085 [Gammaproteobacteria bacterium]|nr:hypothetical protein [Gammaproteobacteria bacterium]